LWYQGESNRNDYQYYAGLMSGLVENWRNDFGVGQFPFYFVQIAPYSYNNSKDILSGKFCDEQLKASLAIPNCGMVSTIDLGEEKNIHPAEKEIIAKRLSYWAVSETYGTKGISYKNPYFKTAVAKDSMMLVTFENAPLGLSSYGKELTNFEVAGEDKVFYPAKAVISSKQLKVSAQEVKRPIAVRYAYCNFPQGKGFLYNSAGLPVPSFRSDDWDK
jgi:sialate O-acetylesterase